LNAYQRCVKLAQPENRSALIDWARVNADNVNAAKLMSEAQCGRGNLIGILSVVK